MVERNGYLYIEDLLAVIEQECVPEGNCNVVKFNRVSTLEEADEQSIIWIKPTTKNKAEIIKESPARVVICDFSFEADDEIKSRKCLIRVREPKYAVINLINRYFKKVYEPSIHQTATISSKAIIAADVYIGASTFIGDGVEIGKNVIIEGNSYIYENTVIGDNSIIQAGAVVGSDGLNLFKRDDKKLIYFPHIGRVVLESNVYIGSNSVVNRGVLGDTYIGEGSKVNKMCVVSHNVQIGRDNFIGHSVCINGSVVIGDCNFIGSGAIIKNKVVVGSDTVIGMGSVVIENVGDNMMVYGNPAKVINRTPNKPLF